MGPKFESRNIEMEELRTTKDLLVNLLKKGLEPRDPFLRLSALGGGTGNLAFFGEGNQNRHAIFRSCLCPSQPAMRGEGDSMQCL